MNNSDMPAMPVIRPEGPSIGLTKREHFAGVAMQGLLAHYGTAVHETYAVLCADALLKNLEK
ncbi:MAG: hypothetical protein ACI9RI_000879 [Oceanospirillaceae bacterium]|jgi:hypothetical protein